MGRRDVASCTRPPSTIPPIQSNGEILWQLRSIPPLRNTFMLNLARLAGNGLLTSTILA